MKQFGFIAILIVMVGCDALRQLDGELSDGYFLGSSIGNTVEPPTDFRLSLVALAENREGSPARFEALEVNQLFTTDFPVLGSVVKVAPDGRHIAGDLLTIENGIAEYQIGLWRVDPFEVMVSTTDDAWPSAVAEQCGYASLFDTQIIASIPLSHPDFDRSLPASIQNYEAELRDSNVEWATTAIGWADQTTALFKVQAAVTATVFQTRLDITYSYQTRAMADIYIGLTTTAGTGINIVSCQLIEPMLADPAPPVYDVRTAIVTGETRFFIDGEELRQFLQPGFPFYLRGGQVQNTSSEVFIIR